MRQEGPCVCVFVLERPLWFPECPAAEHMRWHILTQKHTCRQWREQYMYGNTQTHTPALGFEAPLFVSPTFSHSAVCSEIRAPWKQSAVCVGQVLRSKTINKPWKAAFFLFIRLSQVSVVAEAQFWLFCWLKHQFLHHSTSNCEGHLTLGSTEQTSHFWAVVYSTINVLRCFLCSTVVVLYLYQEILCSFAFVSIMLNCPPTRDGNDPMIMSIIWYTYISLSINMLIILFNITFPSRGCWI